MFKQMGRLSNCLPVSIIMGRLSIKILAGNHIHQWSQLATVKMQRSTFLLEILDQNLFDIKDNYSSPVSSNLVKRLDISRSSEIGLELTTGTWCKREAPSSAMLF
uniref:Uncharacterized protein n=1 Tax=Strigamia maritima TaxID=126957 RepID=T1JP68_STRMM